MKRNQANKAFPRLVWERDRYHPGVKNARLAIEAHTLTFTVSPGFVTIARYFTAAHDGEVDGIREAARRCAEGMHPARAALVKAALDAAERTP
jgi:hypothetical protein